MNKSESLINCNTCRNKKVKCSRELPNCSYCSKRGILCIYSEKVWIRRVSKAGLASIMSKIKVSSSDQFRNLTSRGGEESETPACKFTLFQPILQPINFVDENSEAAVAKIQFNNTKKFQTHILLILSTQIIDYDKKLIPRIGSFVNKIELGVFGKLLKFSIHMNQEWIVELMSPSFEEKCIASYFQNFHPMLTCLSKYKFYTNHSAICPVLKSVILLVGYSSIRKQSPELVKYLKHVAIVHLKKNMFKIRVSICQALFIYSSYLLYQGLEKQSLEYFHQGYLMASVLGIHKDIPGVNEMNRDERRCIRFTSQKHDAHLSCTASVQPHYLFLGSSWTPLNQIYQTNPHSKDPNEHLIAECICLYIKCCNMYWTISANLMSKYSQLTLFHPQGSLTDNNTQAIYVLQTLFNYSLIRILDLHLILSGKCKNLEEREIVKNFAKMHFGLYHSIIMILNSQLSPTNTILELDKNTKKQLWSAEALYKNSIDVNPMCLPMLYRNICTLSLLYIKLILTHGHISQHKELFLGKFKQVYNLFYSYRSKNNLPDGLIEYIDVIANYYKIKA